MAEVTFSPEVGGDGSTVSDDADPATGLANGGHRERFVPALKQTVAVAAHVVEVAGGANTAAATATTAAGAAADSAEDAQASAEAAALFNPANYQARTEKGAANGYASLDGSGKVPLAQISQMVLVDVFTVANQAAMLALSSAGQGDVAIRTDVLKTFILASTPASTLANWKELATPTDVVQSVAGLQGTITGAALWAALAPTASNINTALGYTAANAAGQLFAGLVGALRFEIAGGRAAFVTDGSTFAQLTLDSLNNMYLRLDWVSGKLTWYAANTAVWSMNAAGLMKAKDNIEAYSTTV